MHAPATPKNDFTPFGTQAHEPTVLTTNNNDSTLLDGLMQVISPRKTNRLMDSPPIFLPAS